MQQTSSLTSSREKIAEESRYYDNNKYKPNYKNIMQMQMKRKLLLMTVALLCSVGMWAQDAGTYYIQNVSTGKWLGPGNSWGTQASALSHADYWKLAKISDGVYTLESVVSNGGTNYYLNGTFCDGSATNFTFSAVAGKANTYTIANGSGGLLTASGNIVDVSGSDASAEVSQWKLWSAADMSAGMAAATSENPFDATYLIKDHDLGRNNRDYSSWTNTDATVPKTANNIHSNNKGEATDGDAIYSIEAYHKTFEVKQTLSSVPNGRYALRVNGFYRQDGTNTDLPYLFAGSTNVTFPVRTGSEDDMQAAAESFVAGNYLSDRATTLVTNNTLMIGVKTTGNSCWAIFKNFHLEYYGNAISYYSPADFTNDSQAAAGAWKSYDVNAGWYKIASNASITFYYSQDNSEDADATKSVAISEGGYTYLNLSEGKLYFKSSANATLTLTEGFVANDDITAFFLTNPNFTGNASGWEGNPSYQSNNAEKFNTTFDVYQTATALPAGYYWIKAQAFDRETDQTATYESASSVSKAYLYAGNASTLVKRIYDDASSTQKNSGTNELSFTKNSTTVYIPNMPGAGEKYFDAGLYDNELLMYHSGGDLRIGIKKYVKTGNDWCLFDNFRLIYAGSTPSNGADMTSLITDPSFENNSDAGWTDGKDVFAPSNGSALSGKSGDYYEASILTNQTVSITQNITGLPSGNYILQVTGKAANHNNEANTLDATFSMGGNSIPVRYNAEDTYSVAYNAASDDASALISFGGKFSSRGYFYCDNFTLTYYSTLPDVSISSLTSEAMAADVRAALDAANTAYTSSKTVANYNALQTAIVNAKTSIAEYAAKTSPNADWTGVIVNPSFTGDSENGSSGWTEGWTITGTSGNRQFNAGAAESWSNSNVVFSQVIKSLPAGTYKLTAQVDNCHEDANVALYATCNETTYSTAAPYRACTNYGTTSSNLADDESLCLTTLYLKVEEGKDLTIGAKDESTSGGWMIFDNFKLTYNPTLPESVTAVEGKMNGTVESTQTSAVSTYNSTNNIDNLVAAQAAIYAATKSKVVYNEITTIKSNYDTKAAALDATGQAAYAAGTSATKYTNGTYVTASEAETAYHDDYIAAVKAQDTDNAVYTDVLVNPSFESFGANNVPTGWTLNVGGGYQSNSPDQKKKGGRLVEGGGDYYFAFWTNNPTSSEVYQNINLPAGSYKLSVYVCTAAGTTLTLKAGTETTTVEAANGDAFKMEVSFSLASATDVKVSIGTTSREAWYNMDECQLILTASYYANDADYAALNAAISTATTTYYNHLGFETGDYAPYENINALTKLDAANAIDQTVANTKSSVQTATSDLTGATWNANAGSVNAIYNSNMAVADGNNPKGWSREGNPWGIQVNPNAGDGVGHDFSITSNNTAWYYNNWDVAKSSYYGNTGHYTMPLKANTMYEFKVKYCSQGTGDGGGVVSSYKATIQNGAETAVLNEYQLGENKTQTFVEKKVYFMTTSAGDYVLTLTNIGNIFFTDVSITKVADQTLTLPSETPYAAGTYPTVALSRTFANTSNWYTLCAPFDFPKLAFAEVKVLDKVTDTAGDVNMTFTDASETIAAGTPCLVKPASADATLSVENVAVDPATSAGSIVESDGTTTVTYVGTFEDTSIDGSTVTNAWVVSNNALYHVAETHTATVGAYRAYFTVATGGAVKALSYDFGDAVGIEAIDNGQLTIDNDNVIYNLAGQKMNKLQRGVNIVNGKKVLVK